MAVTAEDLHDALEDAGYEVETYSGRAMFGKRCVGVIIDSAADLFELGRSLHDTQIGTPTLDNMGRKLIAYWPHIVVEDEAA